MDKPKLGYRLLYTYVQWMYKFCYARTFEVRGTENIPVNKPTLFVTNHQNNLPDALSILFASRKRPYFVARADLFNTKISNILLRFIRILPMYRADHGKEAMQNALPETMRELHDHLSSGGACVIMAEGSSAPKRSIRPLKKSWARLADDFQTSNEEIHIIPTVMEYSDWDYWGPDIRVTFGKELILEDKEGLTTAQKLKALKDAGEAQLTEMVASDEEIAAWSSSISVKKANTRRIWQILGVVFVPIVFALLGPIILLAQHRVKIHSRTDFRSTLEIGFIGLGTILWMGILYALAFIFLPWQCALIALISSPFFLWAGSRSYIAYTRP